MALLEKFVEGASREQAVPKPLLGKVTFEIYNSNQSDFSLLPQDAGFISKVKLQTSEATAHRGKGYLGL